MLYMMQRPSPLGQLTLASDGDALVGLWIEGQQMSGVREDPQPGCDLPVFAAAGRWLDAYFAGRAPRPDALPLVPRGSAFQQLIWGMLRDIPYGQLTTYGQLAEQAASRLGRGKMSAQAVGGAVGHNPLSIIIPCHRVVGAGGNLTGYAGGLDKKEWLLRHEGVDMQRLYRPRPPHAAARRDMTQ